MTMASSLSRFYAPLFLVHAGKRSAGKGECVGCERVAPFG